MIYRWLKELAISSVAVPVTIFRVLTSTNPAPIVNSPSPSKLETADSIVSPPETHKADNDSTRKQPGDYIDLEFGRTHYFLKGPKDGQLVVLLHGVSVFSFIWNRFADLLVERGYRVLTFDFYGHGYSAVPQTNYTVDLFRNQFEQLLTKLNLFVEHNSMVLMGHSMGGVVASEFTAKYSDLVKHLILFNSVGLPVKITLQHALPFVFWPLIKVFRATTLLDFAAFKLQDGLSLLASKLNVSYEEMCISAEKLDEEVTRDAHWIGSFIQNAAHTVLDESYLKFARALRFLVHSWAHQVHINSERAPVLLSILRDCPLLDADHTDTLVQISKETSVLIIWGEDDGILPHCQLSEFKKHVEHAELFSIPKTHHAAFLQKPQLVFDTIMNFVQKESVAELIVAV